MIEYSIACALRSRLFDRVIVSTDDVEIAQLSVAGGAEVPFMRPDALADDHAGTLPVVAHAIRCLASQGTAPTAVCCIYATAPFLMEQDLEHGLALLESGGWQYVFSATNYAAPIFRSFRRTASGSVEMFFPDQFATRSQDLPQALHDAAQFYWGRPAAWLEELRIFDEWSTVVEVPRWRVQDIDTEDDWTRAEALARHLMPSGSMPTIQTGAAHGA
jgi:pseudaminic acid cytidylyltransferase